MKILIVDDELNIRESLQLYFKKLGHKVFCAKDGQEGLMLLKKNTDMSICIFDYALTDYNGIALLCKAKLIAHKAIYIIMTGIGTSWNAVESYNCGAYKFLKKPLILNEFSSILKRVEREQTLYKKVDELRSTWNT